MDSVYSFFSKYNSLKIENGSNSIFEHEMYIKKHKVLVIPCLRRGHVVEFVACRDSRFSDWSFVSGNVKYMEGHVEAAERELYEETNGAIHICIGDWRHESFTFTHIESPFSMLYTVFIVDITGYKQKQEILEAFTSSRIGSLAFQEISELSIEPLHVFAQRQLWFCVRRVIHSRVFKTKVRKLLTMYGKQESFFSCTYTMAEIIQKFKQYFLSETNVKTIVHTASIGSLDMSIVRNVQHEIFEMYFAAVCAKHRTTAGPDFDAVLHVLNTITADTLKQRDQSQRQPQQPQQRVEPVSKLVHMATTTSTLQNGRYTWECLEQGVTQLSIDTVKLHCGLYNITPLNNKMTITEPNTKPIDVYIPVGYYTIDDVADCIGNLLSEASPKKWEYVVSRNTKTNRVVLECKKADGGPTRVSVSFGKTSDVPYIVSLNTLLGFEKSEYTNNNIYMAEREPITNVYDNVYLKVFLDNVEVSVVNSMVTHFGYFHWWNVDYTTWFGKDVLLKSTDAVGANSETSITFNFAQPQKFSQVSFEVWHAHDRICTFFLQMDIVMSLTSVN